MSIDKINFLEEERLKLWGRLEELSSKIDAVESEAKQAIEIANHRIIEDENTAKTAAIGASASAENARIKLEEVSTSLSKVKQIVEIFRSNEESFKDIVSQIENIKVVTKTISETQSRLQSIQDNINTLQVQANTSLVNAQNSETQIKSIEAQSSGAFTKINDLLAKSTKAKGDIMTLYDNIMGYRHLDEATQQEVYEDGLRDELENAYEELSEKIKAQKIELSDFLTNVHEQFAKTKENYDSILDEKKARIEELLPGALTAGLSHAYKDKKEAELDNLEQYKKSFKWSIFALVAISLIPVVINLLLLYNGETVVSLMERTPKMLMFILPLYIPVLWLALNANKEIKLSRRLIEEYAHKEVLAKTYQGLAEQIEKLDDDENSLELKNRLLYNIIAASAENPGKLITDYNKTDNPLLEVLDRSAALADSFEKVKNIPGFGKIAEHLKEKEIEEQRKLEVKASVGIKAQGKLNETK